METADGSRTEKEGQNNVMLTSFEPLSYMAIQREIETLQAISVASEEDWQREVSMYEEVIRETNPKISHFNVVPRRNYPNKDGAVQDPELFPYHTACYPLIEAYTQSARNHHSMEALIPGQLLCSPETINYTISGLSSELDPYGVAYAFADENDDIERRLRAITHPESCLRLDANDIGISGLSFFPIEAEARANILIKLLRHAMSDLQNDYLLAGEVILRISRWNLFDDTDNLRRVMCIIESEVKECCGNCFENLWIDVDGTRDHSCLDVKNFEQKVALMISRGIDYISAEHALVFSGIVQLYLDKVNPAASELEESMIDEAINPAPQQSVEDKQRTLLKQKLYLSNNTYYGYEEDDNSDDEEEEEGGSSESQETNWVGQIIVGLGTHAMLARRRIAVLRDRLKQRENLQDHEALTHLLRMSIDSFHNCTRCLVHIGEASLRRLPNNPLVVALCSRLVFCLAQMFVETGTVAYDYNKTEKGTYFKAGRSFIDPNRYAHSILDATKNYRRCHFLSGSSSEGCDENTREAIYSADRFLRAQPDKDVQDLVWCLYAKGLVETSISGCGYGDIQVWWGLTITPLDPLIFLDNCNSPTDEVLGRAWETDEEGNELWGDRLNARYDLSLVLLNCAWQAPWSAESHHSFQKPFRETVRTLLLCANRICMPVDIALHVCVFLRRDWWPDERAQCFSEDCLGKRATRTVNQKLVRRLAGNPPKQKFHKIRACPGCCIASYCCEGHRQSDYRDGHKRLCGNPPFKLPGQKEQELLNDILCLQENRPTPLILNANTKRLIESQLRDASHVEDDDGSGSWESIGSEVEQEEEDSKESLTSIVFTFFERECYRKQHNDED